MIEEDLHVSIGKEIRIMENVHQIGEQEGVEYVSKSGHNSSSLQIYLKWILHWISKFQVYKSFELLNFLFRNNNHSYTNLDTVLIILFFLKQF